MQSSLSKEHLQHADNPGSFDLSNLEHATHSELMTYINQYK